MFHVLVVKEDEYGQKTTGKLLKDNGFIPVYAKDGLQALDMIDRVHIDLVILDVLLPNMNGFELTKILREADSVLPILMICATEEKEYKRKGFLAGTDDYMVKPVDEEELILRIHALLRRAKMTNEHQLQVGNMSLDYDAFSVTVEGEMQNLPKKEFLLLYKLLSYQNKIFTRRQLMDEIWNMDSNTDERTVDVHINRLRKKFRKEKAFEIITVRGMGYKAVVIN